jgi:asparagine synthase (glutamine-hydrolysing)
MCGICGFVGFEDNELLQRMNDLLWHRGPDDQGFYRGEKVALGNRRLSIIDLETGKQPIFNEDKTVCVVYNGEVYNYRDLRVGLERRGHVFRTNSDTEVIVHAYEEIGAECVKELNGCFAFAIWDEKERTLFLARDRLGIRPLHYCLLDGKLAFSSELKPLLLWDKVQRKVSNLALDCYLTLRYLPDSMTMFEGIHKLPPACTLKFKDGRIEIDEYWQLEHWGTEQASPDECADRFYELLKDAVRLRLMSDVPLGAYLSGGIDSSAIVGLMSEMTSTPVKTFTIGGFGAEVDELAEARKIARYFQTEHHELIVGRQDFDLLPRIIWHLDSPIGDAIIIPLFLLAQETSRHVKVVLSGDGADETLAGYVHQLALKYGNLFRRRAPAFLRAVTHNAVKSTPSALLNLFFPYPASLGEKGKGRVLNYLAALRSGSIGQEFLAIASLFNADERKLLYADDFRQTLNGQKFLLDRLDAALVSNGSGFLNSVLKYDMKDWLADCILSKQDHLAMAHSLEARVPFLDHRLVEFTAALPADFKIRGLTNKYLLRKAAARILPPRTVKASKQAFYMPTERCFGPEFDQFVRDVLSSERLKTRGIFNQRYIEGKLNSARSSELVDNKQIIALLVLELWFRIFVDGEGLREGMRP